jgi:general secretion pathway protein D
LSETEFAETVKTAMNSPNSQVNAAPKIILLNGNEVEMTDLVQRPFVVGFQLDGESVKPSIHTLDEGTRLRLVAHLEDSDGARRQKIELKCELTVLRLLDVGTDEVFGIKDEPLTAQVPVQQITSAIASRQLSAGQALLIDPHVSESRNVQSESRIPMLGKIPYVGRTFKNTSIGVVQQHMILLLQPSIEAMAR